MKAIYKILMTAVFSSLFLTACDQELKEETRMEVGVATDNNVSFDGKTITVKKGSPVNFTFNGSPDFISFFSGEIGNEYKYRNRTEMKIEDVTTCDIRFDMTPKYDGIPDNTPRKAIDVYLLEGFQGMAKNNFEADKSLVQNAAWTYLVPTDELPEKAVSTGGVFQSFPYEKDLASYLGKSITIAFHYKGGSNAALRQPTIGIDNLQIDIAFNNNRSETIKAKNFGFTPLNVVNNETDQQHNKVTDREYGAVDGNIAGFWKINVATSILVGGSLANAKLKDSWLISDPILLNGSCDPDRGTAIKNTSQSLDIYAHTYKEAGTYTATFVANNANYVHQGAEVVRELTINVIE